MHSFIHSPVSCFCQKVFCYSLHLYSFPESKSWSFGLDIPEFIPFLSGNMLLYKRFLGFDVGKISWRTFKCCCWSWSRHQSIDRQHVTCCYIPNQILSIYSFLTSIGTKIPLASWSTSVDLIGNVAKWKALCFILIIIWSISS